MWEKNAVALPSVNAANRRCYLQWWLSGMLKDCNPGRSKWGTLMMKKTSVEAHLQLTEGETDLGSGSVVSTVVHHIKITHETISQWTEDRHWVPCNLISISALELFKEWTIYSSTVTRRLLNTMQKNDYANENYLIGFSIFLPLPFPGNWVGRCWGKNGCWEMWIMKSLQHSLSLDAEAQNICVCQFN